MIIKRGMRRIDATPVSCAHKLILLVLLHLDTEAAPWLHRWWPNRQFPCKGVQQCCTMRLLKAFHVLHRAAAASSFC